MISPSGTGGEMLNIRVPSAWEPGEYQLRMKMGAIESISSEGLECGGVHSSNGWCILSFRQPDSISDCPAD